MAAADVSRGIYDCTSSDRVILRLLAGSVRGHERYGQDSVR